MDIEIKIELVLGLDSLNGSLCLLDELLDPSVIQERSTCIPKHGERKSQFYINSNFIYFSLNKALNIKLKL